MTKLSTEYRDPDTRMIPTQANDVCSICFFRLGESEGEKKAKRKFCHADFAMRARDSSRQDGLVPSMVKSKLVMGEVEGVTALSSPTGIYEKVSHSALLYAMVLWSSHVNQYQQYR